MEKMEGQLTDSFPGPGRAGPVHRDTEEEDAPLGFQFNYGGPRGRSDAVTPIWLQSLCSHHTYQKPSGEASAKVLVTQL